MFIFLKILLQYLLLITFYGPPVTRHNEKKHSLNKKNKNN